MAEEPISSASSTHDDPRPARVSTLGIVGEGAIGQGTATIARGFGMKVLFADHAPPKVPDVEYTPFDEVLEQRRRAERCTARSCPATRNLIGLPSNCGKHETERPADQHLAAAGSWTKRR